MARRRDHPKWDDRWAATQIRGSLSVRAHLFHCEHASPRSGLKMVAPGASLGDSLVFSTRERAPFISGTIRDDLHAYLGGILRELGALPIMTGGTADHVHMLVRIPSDLAIADCVRVLKANSSKWVKEKWPDKKLFAWQAGYSAFSVSESNRAAVIAYIQGQAAHHAKRSFQEEFLALLRKHGVEFDERYIWK